MEEENESRHREPDRPSRSDRVTMWTVPGRRDDCDHPPEDVEYTGDDGRNLYFHCRRCGGSLIADGAIHLLS